MIDAFYISRNLNLCTLEDLFSIKKLHESHNARMLEEEQARRMALTTIKKEKKRSFAPSKPSESHHPL